MLFAGLLQNKTLTVVTALSTEQESKGLGVKMNSFSSSQIHPW